jgi:hypothetical protein
MSSLEVQIRENEKVGLSLCKYLRIVHTENCSRYDSTKPLDIFPFRSLS